MPSLRLIAVALLAASAAALFSLGTSAEPLDREICKSLEAEKKTLLTNELRAALERGPDWVKDHLHSTEDIERVRQYLLIEEKVAFRCRTDGVVIPKPMPPPLPDRKPDLPPLQTAATEPSAVLAGAASTSLLPLRKPALSPETEEATDSGTETEVGDAAEDDEEEEVADAPAQETASSASPPPGSSQR